jgi:glycerate 2-kinase
MTNPASKDTLRHLIGTALTAAYPGDAIRSSISLLSSPSKDTRGETSTSTSQILQIGQQNIPLNDIDEIILLAAGKAASSMVEATIDALTLASPTDNVSSSTNISSSTSSSISTIPTSTVVVPIKGVIVTKYNHIDNSLRTKLEKYSASVTLDTFEAGHPTPDENGMKGAQRMLSLLESSTTISLSRSLVIVLLSGGGSALLPLPPSNSNITSSTYNSAVKVPDITLTDIITLTNALLACGASIDEINCVRKHLSLISGGRLAVKANRCYSCITLALSDVIGDRPDVIASGPTVPDPTTYGNALDILHRYNLVSTNCVPTNIIQYLNYGKEGLVPESPKTVPANNHYMLIGGNTAALQRIALEVSKIPSVSNINLNYRPLILTSSLHGEAIEVSKVLGSFIQGLITMNTNNSLSSTDQITSFSLSLPMAIICGGETTVTIDTNKFVGKGGRNMELALATALTLHNLLPPTDTVPYVVCSLGTDGTDGPTDAAGAFITGDTVPLALRHNILPRKYLANHNSYNFFADLNRATIQTPNSSTSNTSVTSRDSSTAVFRASI